MADDRDRIEDENAIGDVNDDDVVGRGEDADDEDLEDADELEDADVDEEDLE